VTDAINVPDRKIETGKEKRNGLYVMARGLIEKWLLLFHVYIYLDIPTAHAITILNEQEE
jgi:hypothetical protein